MSKKRTLTEDTIEKVEEGSELRCIANNLEKKLIVLSNISVDLSNLVDNLRGTEPDPKDDQASEEPYGLVPRINRYLSEMQSAISIIEEAKDDLQILVG